jgi:HAD superfamily hydrolase (TIGR01459 family)
MKNNMIFKSGIEEIADNYEYFIFDIWGVIHDGSNVYPNVLNAISNIRKKNKKICFLSNAPRRSKKVAELLAKFGITPDLYDFIITSGEAVYIDLEKNQKNNFSNFSKNYFYIGPDKDIDLLNGLNYQKVEDAKDASFIISTGFDQDNSIIDEKLPQIIEAKKYNLPMMCVNPDLIVVKQNGQEMLCAGVLANEYKKMNGKVIYYGKPFSLVYKIVCESFSNPENKKIIAIGDGLETDILGANDFGIDNALITGGILSNRLGIKYGQFANQELLQSICDGYKIFPKFVIPSL